MMTTIAGVRPDTGSHATDWSEVTRLLCMAAYTDATFAQDVVDELVDEEHRAVFVPPGIDPAPVVKHCIAALGRKTRRDRLLLADVILSILLAPFTLGGSFLFGFLVAWALIAHDLWSATHRIVRRQLNRRAFDPARAPEPASAELVQRAEALIAHHGGNLTVYSGFLPFSGLGIDIGGWSFVVDLRKGREDGVRRRAPRPVAPADLYEGVRRAAQDLGMDNLTIEDRAFVNGTDVRGDLQLLPAVTGPPRSRLDDSHMHGLIGASMHRVRHYMCIRVTDWGGELVLSLFVRFAIANGRLFCERSGFLLTPLRPDLQDGDAVEPATDLAGTLRLVRRSLLLTPRLSLRSLGVVTRRLARRRRRAKRLRRVQRDVFFDHGAPETALDRVRSSDYSRYFQKLDKEMYTKVLERAILDTIVDVLDAHDVDTGELVKRRSTIINHGVWGIHLTGLGCGHGASACWQALPAVAGRVSGLVLDRCRLPGLPGVAALAEGLCLSALRPCGWLAAW